MNDYVEKLVAGLDNRPQDWKYTGWCNDLGFPSGSCVCGHVIRFQFEIEDSVTGRKAMLGSTCITQYAQFAPVEAERMLNDLDIIMERIRLSKKKAAEEKLINDNAEVINRYVELRGMLSEKCAEIRRVKGWVPYTLWKSDRKIHRSVFEKYKSVKRAINYMIDKLPVLESLKEVAA